MELSSPKLKKLLIFQKGTYKGQKTNKKFVPKNFLVSCNVFIIFIGLKHREIPCEANLNLILLSQERFPLSVSERQ